MERRLPLADDWVTPLYDFIPTYHDLNVMASCLVGFAIVVVMMLDGYKHRAAAKANKVLNEDELPRLTLDMVGLFDGRHNPLVYCCLKGRIYDVSTSRNFTPGGNYHFLSGKDCTVGMAKMSYERHWVNDMDFGQLTQDEWDALEEWVNYMQGRYKCVGLLCEYLDYEESLHSPPEVDGAEAVAPQCQAMAGEPGVDAPQDTGADAVRSKHD